MVWSALLLSLNLIDCLATLIEVKNIYDFILTKIAVEVGKVMKFSLQYGDIPYVDTPSLSNLLQGDLSFKVKHVKEVERA